MYEIVDAFKILKKPLLEKVNFPHIYEDSNGRPIQSKECMVLYIHIKRMKQMLSKKNNASMRTMKRDMRTGLLSQKDKAAQEKMGIALAKLAEEDPTFKAYTNHETGQTIIAGMGELHLDIIVDRLKREFKVECNVGKPQVAYKETIKDTVKVEGKFIRQSGGRGQYGHVWLEMEPLEPGKGIEFESKIVGGVVPKEYIKPVEEGIREAAESGILAGYPVIDFKATLVDGSYHDVDSSEMAFKIAGSMALKDGLAKATDYISRVFGDNLGNQPTITPVVDLSEVRASTKDILSMLDLNSSVGIVPNIKAISTMMNRRNQNGTNDDVVDAIGKLRKDLGNVNNTTYSINGITYNSDSDVGEAIETLVRAIRIEGRV